jgi:ATP-dependent Lhr-like helicase
MMEWLYTDDTPRAEREAAMLAVDPVLLSEVMGGAQGAVGSDDTTMQALTELVADRRGTSPRRRARTADELAHVLDQAGDLALEELHLRAAPREGWIGVGDAADELLRQGRVIEIQIPARDGGVDWRVILVENFPRYAAAFGRDTLDPVRTWTTEGIAPQERSVDDALPQQFRNPVVEPRVARREILTRFVSLAGPVTVREIAERYGWDETWIRARLTEWEAANKLMRAKFRREVSEPEWCLRALVDRARRRALAAVRRQIEPVDLSTFGAFLRRWQHLDPRDRLSGPEGVKSVLRQLAGLPRPPERWERDYLPSRLERYDAAWLSHLASTGQLVWAGMTREDRDGVPPNLSAIRFFPREDSALWIGPDHDSDMAPSAPAQRVVEALRRNGASFLADLQAATGLTPVVLREALRELVALGRVTNDTVEAMREVVRTWPLPPREQDGGADASRWLPSHFTPSVGRPVVQRRASIRRLPKWRRPDLPGPTTGWVGRWSLLHLDRVPSLSEDEHAELVARRWLDRYGIVTSDWWRRERPPVAWRSVYRELKRLEYRGEVRRGYFVEGMAGAQFALPAAVEQLRAAREEGVAAPMVVLAASDPANPFTLPLMSRVRSALENPRGAGALLAVRGNVVVLSAESMGRRLTVCGDADAADVTAAAHTLGVYVRRRRESVLGGARTTGDVRARCVVEQIDGEPAGVNRWGAAVATAGFRRVTQGFEFDPLRE